MNFYGFYEIKHVTLHQTNRWCKTMFPPDGSFSTSPPSGEFYCSGTLRPFLDFLPSSGPSYGGGGEVYDHDLGQSDYQSQSEVSISYGTNNSNVSYGHQVNNQQPNYNQNYNQHHQHNQHNQQDQYVGDQHQFKGMLPSHVAKTCCHPMTNFF